MRVHSPLLPGNTTKKAGLLRIRRIRQEESQTREDLGLRKSHEACANGLQHSVKPVISRMPTLRRWSWAGAAPGSRHRCAAPAGPGLAGSTACSRCTSPCCGLKLRVALVGARKAPASSTAFTRRSVRSLLCRNLSVLSCSSRNLVPAASPHPRGPRTPSPAAGRCRPPQHARSCRATARLLERESSRHRIY